MINFLIRTLSVVPTRLEFTGFDRVIRISNQMISNAIWNMIYKHEYIFKALVKVQRRASRLALRQKRGEMEYEDRLLMTTREAHVTSSKLETR